VSYYFNPLRGMVKVDLEGGFWVRLRHVTVDESREIDRISEQNPEKAGILGLLKAIHDWNLTDENQAVAPITEEWVGKIPQGDFRRIVNAVGEMTGVALETMTPEQEAALKAKRVRFPDGAGNSGLGGSIRPGGTAGVPNQERVVEASRPSA
jgi:hypothetical protein